jgi:broad specificity phosphatase PhoE
MKRFVTLRCVIIAGILVGVLCGCLWWYCSETPTTILLVRHANRPLTDEDALTPDGVVRAQELVHVGRKSGVVAIFRTNTNRSRDTAKPLADALGLTPVIYSDVAGVVSQIFADFRGKTVLVVAHSDTVPAIIAEVGGPTLAEIPRQEFDDLFVVTAPRCRCRRTTVTQLQYGAESP